MLSKVPKLICFICLLVLHAGVMAQVTKPVIKGVLKDSITGKSIGYATVGLYKTGNPGKAIKNVFSGSKGEYQFSGIDTGNYNIVISAAGYTEKQIKGINVTATSGNIEAGTVALVTAPKELEGVTVSSTRKPLIEKSEDKIIFNAEADPTVDGQQATDVLRKTPFLSVDNDGNVTLNGQTNFKILLNGKESAMFARDPKEVLKSFPASLIKKIEVITQPSAKYDAEGIGGIINIITKKKILGYNGNINTNGSTMGNRNINASVNAKYGPWGFSGYAGTGGANDVPGSSENVTNNLDTTAGSYRQRLLYGATDRSWAWRTINTELTFDIDSLNTLSAYVNAGGGNDADNFNQQSSLVLPMWDTTQGVLNTQGNDQYRWSDMGLDYIRKFTGAEDKEFTFRFNRQYDYENVISNSQQLQQGLERYVITNNLSHNYQYTFQSDFILPLQNKRKLEMGVKAILRRADADYEGQIAYTPGKYTLDTSNTNIFHYDQNIVAAYTTYGFNIKKTFFKLGVRGEWSTLGGNFQNKATIQQNYFNVVPTVYISRTLPHNQTISLSYNIRLQRPYITDLDPFVDKSDSLNLRYGNPNLKPQIIHNMELGYTYFKGPNSVNIKLSGFYSNNKITQYAIFDAATGITDWTSDNIGRNYGSSLSGFISLKPAKWWTFSSNLGLRYDFIINKYDASMSNHGLSGWSNFNNTFDLNKTFAAGANAGMRQGGVSLQQKQGLNYWYGLNGAIKLKNNKFRITVQLNNFLNDHLVIKTINSGTNFNGYQKLFNTGRTIGFSLRWNFGKLTDNVSKKIGVNNDDLKK